MKPLYRVKRKGITLTNWSMEYRNILNRPAYRMHDELLRSMPVAVLNYGIVLKMRLYQPIIFYIVEYMTYYIWTALTIRFSGFPGTLKQAKDILYRRGLFLASAKTGLIMVF